MTPGHISKAAQVRAFWHGGERDREVIARAVSCSVSYVGDVLRIAGLIQPDPGRRRKSNPRLSEAPVKRMPRAGNTCQRPDVGNGLKPCGRPRHVIAGEAMGVCEMHWNLGRPITGQKLGVSEQW